MRALEIVETLSSQTAVHRKKFEYAVTQLRPLILSIIDQLYLLGNKTQQFVRALLFQFQDLQTLLSQNILQTWTNTTLENPCNYVLEQLKRIFTKINDILKRYEQILTFEKRLWTPEQLDLFNIYDLRALEGSFTQCIDNINPHTELYDKVQKRLKSIEKKLQKEDKPLVPITTSPIPSAYQNWTIQLSEFEIIKEIGHGVSAKVFLAKDTRLGIDPKNSNVAIKQFQMTRLNGSRFQSFQREVAVLASCQHPALISLIGMTDTMPFSIITPYMPFGSLFHDLHHAHLLDSTMKSIAAYDIARGMQYLHSREIAHRDLKSLNVLIDKDLHVKLCDFGFSKHISDSSPMKCNIGTPHWMAPEILANETYTAIVDVYAYGIVLWEISTGKTPYSGIEPKKIKELVLNQDIRPEITYYLSPELTNLISVCWNRKPEARPSFDTIVKLFKTKTIYFPGTDLDKFSQYIDESATSGEVLSEEIEGLMENLKNGKVTFESSIRILSRTGIPSQFVDLCWSTIESIATNQNQNLLCEALLLFSKTPKYIDAVKKFRKMEPNSIPVEIITKLIKDLPTGSEEIDRNITIAACRNNNADLCAIYLTNPKLIALALDAACQTSIDQSLKHAVTDKCYTSIITDKKGKDVIALKCAALRCLLVLHEIRRIPMTFLIKVITSYLDGVNQCIEQHHHMVKSDSISDDLAEAYSYDADKNHLNDFDQFNENIDTPPQQKPNTNNQFYKNQSNDIQQLGNQIQSNSENQHQIFYDENTQNENEEIDQSIYRHQIHNENQNDINNQLQIESNQPINENVETQNHKNQINEQITNQEDTSSKTNLSDSLLSLAFLATTAAALEGIDLPPELVVSVLDCLPDQRALATCIALTQRDETVDLILNRILNIQPSPLLLKILLSAMKFENRHPLLADVVKEMDFSELMEHFKPAIETIQRCLKLI